MPQIGRHLSQSRRFFNSEVAENFFQRHRMSYAYASTSTASDEKQLVDITSYLVSMQKNDIYKLGLVLGLNNTKLRAKINSDTFLEDVIAAWLNEEDYVKAKGDPTWTVLIDALKHLTVKQTGIADKIAKEKGLS